MPMTIVYVISGAILDLIHAILPLTWKMQMPMGRRVSVIGIFLLGTLGVVGLTPPKKELKDTDT